MFEPTTISKNRVRALNYNDYSSVKVQGSRNTIVMLVLVLREYSKTLGTTVCILGLAPVFMLRLNARRSFQRQGLFSCACKLNK